MSEPDLVVLVPALRRPENVQPLVDSVIAHTPVPHRIVFICDADDFAEQRACHAAGVDVQLYQPVYPEGPYPAKINAGVHASSEPFVFLGADDLRFRDGWWPAALAALELGAEVVGVNDLIPRTHRPGHATHFLLTRDYAEQPAIGGERGPLYEGYQHWFVDDELIATAKARGVYFYAAGAEVEHLHPMVGKAEDDQVYRSGRMNARRDRRRFHARRQRYFTAQEAAR